MSAYLDKFNEEINRKSSWLSTDVKKAARALINDPEVPKPKWNIKPKTIQFADIVAFEIKGTNHPCIVIKLEEAVCYGIILSTKAQAHHFLSKIETSRLLYESNFTFTIVSMKITEAIDNFVIQFDAIPELKRAIKLLKLKYKTLLL